MSRKANLVTETTSNNKTNETVMDQEVISFGPYQEGNKVSSMAHETISTGRQFQFVRVAYALSFIMDEGESPDNEMDLADDLILKLIKREVLEAKGEEFEVVTDDLPRKGRALEVTFGMTIPTARYQSEKFDVSLSVNIPDNASFPQEVAKARAFIEKRMVRRMKIINDKIKGNR